MPKKKAETRNVPTKNYVIAIFVFLAIILTSLYALKWYQVKEKELYRESYLIKSGAVSFEIKDLFELKQVIQETPDTYFVFIGYRDNKDEYILEKELKPLITQYNLKDIFYYVDATDVINKDNYKSEYNKYLNLTNEKITKAPVLLYFKEGTYKLFDENIKIEFKNLLEKEDFEKIAK